MTDHRIGIGAEDAARSRQHRRRVERMRAARVLVHQHAERKDVGPGIDLLAVQLLGRHVRRRADDRTRLRHAGERGLALRLDAGEAEVEHLEPTIGAAHDVLRLEVAMGDAGRMRAGDRLRELSRRRQDLGAGRAHAARHLLAQRAAFDELRGDVGFAVDLVERVDGADAGMGQRPGGARFSAQAIALRRIADQARWQRLERDGPAEPGVDRPVHATHAAAADLADNPVRPDRLSRLQRRSFVPAALAGCSTGDRRARILGEQRGQIVRRLGQERAGPRVVAHQRDDLFAHRRIVRRSIGEPAAQVGRRLLDRLLEELADLLPPLAGHAASPPSSRNSQARASAQRRFSVAGDMPSTSAASSTLRPTK